MTLVEMLIVVVVLSILAVIALPAITAKQRSAQDAAFVTNMRLGCDAFRLYRAQNGSYPPDRWPAIIPPGMEGYLKGLNWTEETPIGGMWDWDNGQFGYTAGVSVYMPDRTDDEMDEVDALLDNGNLNTGGFRKRQDGYISIIEP